MKQQMKWIGLMAIAGAGLVGCEVGKPATQADADIFKTEVVSALNLVRPSGGPKALRMAPSSFSEEQKKGIQEALPTIDLLLDNSESGFRSVKETVKKEIDGENYEFQETITFLNSELKEASYQLFYNETLIVEKDDDDDDEDEIEQETTSMMSGLAFIDANTSYSFVSMTETEEEGDEAETERYFKIDTGVNSYIRIKEEFEVEGTKKEQDLHYTVVENGAVSSDYKVEIGSSKKGEEIEIEVGKTEFEVKRQTREDGVYYTVSLEQNRNESIAVFKKEILEDGTAAYRPM